MIQSDLFPVAPERKLLWKEGKTEEGLFKAYQRGGDMDNGY